jgi:thiamine biosynthesis lipoprotein
MYTSTAALKSIGAENSSAPILDATETTMLRTSESRNGTSRLRIGLGTLIAIEAQAATSQQALAGIETAYRAIAQVEKLMHPTRPGSDLFAIRGDTLGLPVALHPWTWEVLALSRRMNRESKGAFDPCLPSAAGRFSDLEFVLPHCVIPHLPLHIDLGGIAKGYAVDRALMALRASGCHGGLVNAGGDLAVFGDRIHRVVVRDPSIGDCMVELYNAALATSDVCGAAKPAEHRGYYDGSNGRKIRSGSVTVTAGKAAIADALTKCVLASPGQSSEALLKAFGARRVTGDIDP